MPRKKNKRKAIQAARKAEAKPQKRTIAIVGHRSAKTYTLALLEASIFQTKIGADR